MNHNIKNAIGMNPKNAEDYFQRGIIQLDKNNFQEAISDFSKAIELNPFLSDAYCNRGNAWYHAGDIQKA